MDPGHGGKDSGSEWGEITEKDINLAVVKETAKILESDGFTVVLTRRSDTKVSKDARVKLAEEKKADVFVSVHQNYVDDDTTSHGIETYCNASVNGRSAVLAGKVQAR